LKSKIKYGLIGHPLTHSFSKKYFTSKFEQLKTNAAYELFDIENINELPAIINRHPDLIGLNVTIPYKQSVIPFLTRLDDTAAKVGAVNTIKINQQPGTKNHELIGYNTDVTGFRESIKPFLESSHSHALILGTGGAAKAVSYVLKELGVNTFFVSRKADPVNNILSYSELTKNVIDICKLIINTTPVGMFPNINDCPSIPYNLISPSHFLYDLIYNPEETLFLKKAKEKGCATLNGSSMFYFQAEKAWGIWNE